MKCNCWKPEHGPQIHEQGCAERLAANIKIDVELDALAAQIFAINVCGLFAPKDAYELAQEFLDYKKSRSEK